jgi:predicted component of type VI protein secretion system
MLAATHGSFALMPAQLVSLNDGPSILVDKPILLLGRHPECDIQIDSRKISRRHCCIAQVHDYLVVRDLDSTNGIRINGVRVVEGKLKPGDELTIGNHRYQVAWDDAPVRAGSPRKGAAMPPPAVPMRGDEDDMLEGCDEPVPLADPSPVAARPQPQPQAPLPPAVPVDDESVVLPENLELMPSSGSFPGIPKPAPK